MVDQRIKFTSAVECKAKAASLRTVSAHAHNPESKARMIEMALYWDARAAEHGIDL
jgi:hypothetical protein